MAIWNKTDETPSPSKPPTPTSRPSRASPAAKGSSVLGPGLRVEGKLEGGDDVRLEGHFTGEARVPKGQLTVAVNGEVHANLSARTVLVEGKVVGDVHGGERVTVRKGATVEGNISAPRVVLEDGCRVTGAIDMAERGAASGGAPKAVAGSAGR